MNSRWRPMTTKDLARLGSGHPDEKTTHLERFQTAFERSARHVRHVTCPVCGARPGRRCEPS